MLSCADVGVFRPVWQAERTRWSATPPGSPPNGTGIDLDQARTCAEATMAQMRRAFPDACAATELWTPLVGQMT